MEVYPAAPITQAGALTQCRAPWSRGPARAFSLRKALLSSWTLVGGGEGCRALCTARSQAQEWEEVALTAAQGGEASFRKSRLIVGRHLEPSSLGEDAGVQDTAGSAQRSTVEAEC